MSDLSSPESSQLSSEDSKPPTLKRKRKRNTKATQIEKEKVVYQIPEVKTLPTTFRGRLGYACLNTVLRNRRPAREAVFCSRTCRIDTMQKLGKQHAQELGLQNARDLVQLIQWNEENRIRFLRVSSEMFPFAAHKTWGYDLDYAKEELAQAGELARKYGHRLTTHPGQFTQLGSPRKEVVDNAIRDLQYHCSMLDLMGMGCDSVMILHGGGTYNDKPAAIERIKQNIEALPSPIRARLVLENDEMCYNAEDLLPLCEELDVPLVFDYHHDWIYPSSIPPKEIIKRANEIFKRRGIRPKQHLSSPRPGAQTVMEKRAHANRCETFPPDLPDDVDLMIEAKDKEQAVLHLYRIYQLEPVIQANLRPAVEHESLQTNGRKSNSPRKRTVQRTIEEEVIVGDNDDPDGCQLGDQLGEGQETNLFESPKRSKRKMTKVPAMESVTCTTSVVKQEVNDDEEKSYRIQTRSSSRRKKQTNTQV